MKKRVAVKHLVVGMYVVQVTKSTGAAVMTSKGVIKHLAAIEKLKALGVTEVEIDTTKSLLTSPAQPSTTQNQPGN